MEVAGGDGDNVGQVTYAARSFDRDRNVAVGRGESLSQLTERVIAAGPDGAIGFEHERVRAGVADGDGDEAVATLGRNRSRLPRDGGADAQLSQRVVAGRQ